MTGIAGSVLAFICRGRYLCRQYQRLGLRLVREAAAWFYSLTIQSGEGVAALAFDVIPRGQKQ